MPEMSSKPAGPGGPGATLDAARDAPAQMAIPAHVDVALRSFGQPNSARWQFDFLDESYEWRRVFSELFGTFLLVLAAAGGGMVNARDRKSTRLNSSHVRSSYAVFCL